MSFEFLADYAWIVWLALILIFLIVEMSTLEFTFLMLAIGSVGGLLADLAGLPWWAQIVIAGLLAVLLLLAVKPPLLRRLRRGGDTTRTLVDALIGIEASVTRDFIDGQGQARLANGETWTARAGGAHPLPQLNTGDRVIVTAIEGATAVVVPAERTTP